MNNEPTITGIESAAQEIAQHAFTPSLIQDPKFVEDILRKHIKAETSAKK